MAMNNEMQKRYKRRIYRTSASSLEFLDEMENALPSFDYFKNKLKSVFVDFDKDDNEYIGSYCVMVPDELIYSFDYRPLRLCASHYVSSIVGDEIMPRDSCPLMKSTAGIHQMQVLSMYEKCKLAVMPLTCDCKKKSVSILSKYLPIVPMELPRDKSEDGFLELVNSFKGLIKTIEEETGRTFSRRKLVQACKDVNQAQKAAYNLYKLAEYGDSGMTGMQVMAVMNSYIYDTPKVWTEHVNDLVKEAEKNMLHAQPGKKKKPKILITGSPISFPNYKIPFLLEKLGAQIIGDETCMSGRLLYDPVVSDNNSTDDILRALASRYVMACSCPVFQKTEDDICRLKTKVKKTGADGIIYHVLRGCIPYDFELAKVEQMAKELNIPVIRIETDFSNEDREQIMIRLEAFIEMIEGRKFK